MEHFTWDLSPEGICSGGNGVSCTTEDMLKVGNLFLNMGQWNGKQILTEEWCRMAIGLDKVYEGQGDYAFHWTDKHDGNYTSTAHTARSSFWCRNSTWSSRERREPRRQMKNTISSILR